MRIAFFLTSNGSGEEAPHVSAVTTEIVERLRSMGALVDLLVPETRAWDLANIRPEYDLYVLKSKTPLTMSLAGALTMAGAVIVNGYRATVLTKDKVASTAVLAAAGVPVPPSWTTGRPDLLSRLVNGAPVWIKPSGGSRGRGVFCVRTAGEMRAVEAQSDPWGLPLPLFAQQGVETSGKDLKVYVVGEKMWAITRPWPAVTMEDKLGRPAEIPPSVRETARACGRALGLELYGVDFLLSGDQSWVVDVNALPGFKGPVEAPAAIAHYLHQRAQGLYRSTGKVRRQLSEASR
ncbi:MAG: hypothetical protein OEV28_03095 [Nitrospirota bacterium]|nr:hypothetical protein [Nitrospirota bacterium]